MLISTAKISIALEASELGKTVRNVACKTRKQNTFPIPQAFRPVGLKRGFKDESFRNTVSYYGNVLNFVYDDRFTIRMKSSN